VAKLRTVNTPVEAQSSRPDRHTDHVCLSPWPNWWRCGASLGCRRCAASVVCEVFCWSCLSWGTLTALLEHGPLVPDEQHHQGRQPPPPNAYPPQWLCVYRRSDHSGSVLEREAAA
jgi:hypothetical protein